MAEEIWVGIGGQEGSKAEGMMGRANGPRLVWKCALGPPGDCMVHSTLVSRSWARIVGWCSTIRQARAHNEARENQTHPMACAARVAQRRI